MTTFWTQGGKILKDAMGKIIRCASCPCGSAPCDDCQTGDGSCSGDQPTCSISFTAGTCAGSEVPPQGSVDFAAYDRLPLDASTDCGWHWETEVGSPETGPNGSYRKTVWLEYDTALSKYFMLVQVDWYDSGEISNPQSISWSVAEVSGPSCVAGDITGSASLSSTFLDSCPTTGGVTVTFDQGC